MEFAGKTANMSGKTLLLSLLTLAALLLRSGSGVAGHLNVFLNPVEVMRLLGESPPTFHLLCAPFSLFVLFSSSFSGRAPSVIDFSFSLIPHSLRRQRQQLNEICVSTNYGDSFNFSIYFLAGLRKKSAL